MPNRFTGPGPIAPRFWAKVDRRGPDDCWEWQRRSRHNHGYGTFRKTTYESVKAHRLAYELEIGPVPDGLEVCHRCDNPPCCNPAHLFLGSHADNLQDMRAKGRDARGERNGQAKLTDEVVATIRLRYASEAISQRALGREYGIGQSHVSDILGGRKRVHISSPP